MKIAFLVMAIAMLEQGPAGVRPSPKVALLKPPPSHQSMWQGILTKLGNHRMVRERVEELGIDPVAAENSTPAHPTFRANLWLKCVEATQTKKLSANPSGMRIGVFERWILRAVQQRCAAK